jgi:hypothetical protein
MKKLSGNTLIKTPQSKSEHFSFFLMPFAFSLRSAEARDLRESQEFRQDCLARGGLEISRRECHVDIKPSRLRASQRI